MKENVVWRLQGGRKLTGDRKLTGRWLGFALLCGVAWGHDAPTTKLTWTREISRLVTQRCVGCHQPGGAAPFSLRTFAEARPWAVAIKEEVLQRKMPPWPAAKGFGSFANDISMPQEEVNRLAEWAEGGAPEGEAAYLRPSFAVPLWRAGARPKGQVVRLEGRLDGAVMVLALRGGAKAGKVWAEMADGRVVPLVWFTGAGQPQWMILREPIRLPAGSVIRGFGVEAVVR